MKKEHYGNNPKNFKYGIFLGRFQPFHKGHQAVIDKIKEEGLEPVVIVGSAQEFNTIKNPIHILDRMGIINENNPGIKVLALHDNDSWEEWNKDFEKTLALGLTENYKDECLIYTHNKKEDRCDFEYKGNKYKNSFYSLCFNLEGLKTTNLPEGFSKIDISATKLRKNLEENKQFITDITYKRIKELQEIYLEHIY